eukprot:NODE_63_length_25098_cov_0.440498.p10 type:complete len:314 gc:universal NODE_63_length_25098_cov_0.440498:6678-5737(-)
MEGNKNSREIASSLHVLPFYRSPEGIGLVKKVKIFIGSVGLLPIRLLLCPIGVIPPYLLSFLPMKYNSWSHVLFTKTCKWSARFLLFICGFYKLNILDKRNGKETSRLIISNHVSLFDFLIIVAVHDEVPSFIGRSQISKIPFFGRVANQLNCLYTNGESNGVSKSLSKSLNNPGPPVAVFPEATTTNGYFVISFKTGAFVPGVAVLPMTFSYPYNYFSPAFDSLEWKSWLFRILTEFYHSCTVTIYPLYYPDDHEKSDPVFYAENVQTFISDKLAIPCYATSRWNQLIYCDFLQNKLTFSEAYERIYNKEIK